MLRGLRLPFPATAGAAERDLARRLRQLARLFDLDALLGETPDDARVKACYRECHSAYRTHHSPEGAAHMALDPGGRFDPDGFAEQLRRIEARWPARPPQGVLEIGFGQGYKLGWLATRHPATRFHGIDLTPERSRNVLSGGS
jgi:hypothetical protein